jgi:type IV secretory pathway VirB2 component (pilin)
MKVRTIERIGLMGAIAIAVVASAMTPAAAQDLTSGINNLLALLKGPFILAIATLAIIGVGLAWAFGRIQLHTAMSVIVGIVIAGSAASLAGKIVGTT